jgi:hypothetical protein
MYFTTEEMNTNLAAGIAMYTKKKVKDGHREYQETLSYSLLEIAGSSVTDFP